ncbi:hypothetical protein CWC56_12880 [Enterococcus faecalis]|uniref:Uncharacterized protein n=1 Tax=Enterococcus faecalis TaxID=1351 RepID=A0A3N3GBM5_ENTFL|nr:hypothetical protein CEQ16_02105 [Enterococcus faecalis]EEN73832.1 hypothetical protein HMPREF0349_2136 [Enterococcus faecalis TX1322]EFT91140.1 hypothetical protein HMPREF9497_01908 [Enterococcus faecalis TX4244]OOC97163.1 hypothetical protein BWO99_03620 [Enterococcus faecalis ATCC 29212]AVR93022.1 hypothetical protein CEQ02_14785 [Enterococcus faecalis]
MWQKFSPIKFNTFRYCQEASGRDELATVAESYIFFRYNHLLLGGRCLIIVSGYKNKKEVGK